MYTPNFICSALTCIRRDSLAIRITKLERSLLFDFSTQPCCSVGQVVVHMPCPQVQAGLASHRMKPETRTRLQRVPMTTPPQC